MKTIKYLFIVLFALSVAFTFNSCSKEDTAKTFMVVNKWKPVSKKVIGIESIKDCEKDDVWDFKSDNTYAIRPGNVKCGSEEVKAGTWKLEGSKLTLDGLGIYTVEEASPSELIIKVGTDNVDLTVWTFKVTL